MNHKTHTTPTQTRLAIRRSISRSMGFVVFVWMTASASVGETATYYVRTDGGTASQCTGLTNAPYPGSGMNQACAWSHPFWGLNSSGAWKIQGSDTLMISSGSYRMGIGAPNTGWCDAEGAYICHLPPRLQVFPLRPLPELWGPDGIRVVPIHRSCGELKDPGRLLTWQARTTPSLPVWS